MGINSGIYIIQNLSNGKVYIGQSRGLRHRLIQHKSELKRNVHYNSHLQRTFNESGISAFSFKVLEFCESDVIDDRERYWISFYNSGDDRYGYNYESGGSLHKIHSEETRRKMRKPKSREAVLKSVETRKGFKHSAESLLRMSNSHKGHIAWNKGEHWTDEQRKVLSEAHQGPRPWRLGFKHSEETKQKISETKKASMTDEERKRMREMRPDSSGMKGKKHSEESKRKMSQAMKGRQTSEETRQKLSQAKKGCIPWNKGLKKKAAE